MPLPPILSVRDLSYRYDRANDWIIRNVTFELQRGTLNVLIGPTGSGKSTLLRAVAGILPLVDDTLRGTVVFEDRSYQDSGICVTKPGLGLLLQDPARQLHQEAVFDEIVSTPAYRGYPWPECLERASKVAGRLLAEALWSRRSSELSVGEQQRVAIAALLAADQTLVMFDEPTSYLDGPATRVFDDIVRDLIADGVTVLMTTHEINWIGRAPDRIILLDSGRVIVCGIPQEVLPSDELRESLGEPLPLLFSRGREAALRPLSWPELSSQLPICPDKWPTSQGRISAPGDRSPALQVSSLSVSIGDRLVLEDISFRIARGETVGLLGPNGSGKSTLAKTLAVAGRAPAGTAAVSGIPLHSLRQRELSALVAFVAQNPSDMLFETTLLREVSFGPKVLNLPGPEDRATAAIVSVGLSGFEAAHPRSLSAGQQRLAGIACALAATPAIMILDEPEFGLDGVIWTEIESVLERLTTSGTAILIITHSFELASRCCDRVIVLENRRTAWTGDPVAPPWTDSGSATALASAVRFPGALNHIRLTSAALRAFKELAPDRIGEFVC